MPSETSRNLGTIASTCFCTHPSQGRIVQPDPVGIPLNVRQKDMKTKRDIHDLWRVTIRERLYSGYATKSEGEYLVRVSPAAAAAYLNHQQPGGAWSEDQITAPEQAWVTREVVDWHFHMTYNMHACVAVSCGASKADDATPARDPDNIVQGVPVWELAAK